MSYAIFRSESINTLKDLGEIGAHNKRDKKSYKSNPDIDMSRSKNKQRLEKVNESTKKTLEKSKQVKEIVNNLKPTRLIKNNYLISDDDINTIN